MQLKTKDNKRYLEAARDDLILENASQINDLLSLCYEHDTNRILLNSTNLVKSFFDISSQVAGDFMQKLTTYQTRCAIVMLPDTETSSLFHQMASDTNRMGCVRFFEDYDTALSWLIG